MDANRLYIVRLEEADGEMRLGLIATEAKPFQKQDQESSNEVPHVKGLWFKRCSDAKDSWGPSPEFEKYMDAKTGRITDDLPIESCLLEVEDKDLTDGSVGEKWSKPKLKQTMMAKVRWIAEKYGLKADEKSAPPAKRAKRSRRGEQAQFI